MGHLSFRVSAPFFIFIALLSPSTAHAQIDRAEINGTVIDTSGAVIPGASIHLLQRETGATRDIISGESGTFALSSLPIGRFVLTVTHPGFSDLQVPEFELNAGITQTINARLQIAGTVQMVSVEADNATNNLNKNDATLGGTIQSAQISRIPP